MIIQVNKFGNFLTSRPAGREAYLSAKAYTLPKNTGEEILLDFSGVKVLSPSLADEFITALKQDYTNVSMINTNNPSVQASLKSAFGMSVPKKIDEKNVGDITYTLIHWQGDQKFVIEKFDNSIKSIQRLPEVGVFDNEKSAREFLNNL